MGRDLAFGEVPREVAQRELVRVQLDAGTHEVVAIFSASGTASNIHHTVGR
jgi:hypothetical protein